MVNYYRVSVLRAVWSPAANCKNVDKWIAAQIKAVLGLLIFSNCYVVTYFSSSLHLCTITPTCLWDGREVILWKMYNVILFYPYSPAQGFITYIQFQSSRASNSTQGSCLTQPLSTTADPKLLHWDRARLNSLLKGFSRVVTVGAENVSCSFPYEIIYQMISEWNGVMWFTNYKEKKKKIHF